jgi:hypothetical protein
MATVPGANGGGGDGGDGPRARKLAAATAIIAHTNASRRP